MKIEFENMIFFEFIYIKNYTIIFYFISSFNGEPSLKDL